MVFGRRTAAQVRRASLTARGFRILGTTTDGSLGASVAPGRARPGAQPSQAPARERIDLAQFDDDPPAAPEPREPAPAPAEGDTPEPAAQPDQGNTSADPPGTPAPAQADAPELIDLAAFDEG